jgi:predicted neuraminidase
MKRILALSFLMVAAVAGFLHVGEQPIWAPFAFDKTAETISTNQDNLSIEKMSSKEIAKTSAKTSAKISVGEPLLNWLPDTGAASVHAGSLIALKDGGMRAFWFAGSREGAKDVVINTAVYDQANAQWSPASVVMDRVSAEKGLSRYIAKLGNPVPARMADGRIQLFFVTVSIGGWAGSSISTVISEDEGVTWSQPKRLITSPMLNLSTLVKSPTVMFSDGRLGLPAYHEWIGRFGEFLRLDGDQVIDKRRISSGRSAIQPAVFLESAEQASALFRQTRGADQAKQIPVSQTANAGQSWQVAADIAIPNPNAAIAVLTLNQGARLMALNNIERGRHRLVLMMSDGPSSEWRVMQVLEDDETLPIEGRQEFSYPFLMSANGSDAHLVYTWDRKRIRHVYFGSNWLAQARNQLSAPAPAHTPEAN